MEDSKKARFDLDNFGNPGDRKAFRWSYLESLMNQVRFTHVISNISMYSLGTLLFSLNKYMYYFY